MAEGTPRETQNEGQAVDVRMADVQSDRQSQTERVAHPVTITNPNMQEVSQRRLVWPHHALARQSRRVTWKHQTPQPAWCACLRPTLLVRACGGGEHAVNDGSTPGQWRKLSSELTGKRAAVAETGAWTELLRLHVRDMLAREIHARGPTPCSKAQH